MDILYHRILFLNLRYLCFNECIIHSIFMRYIADLHIHSRFARACSKSLTLENIDKHCALKGVGVVATGDYTHPQWFREMKNTLVEKEPGLYVCKNSKTQTRFLCSVEISCIYSKGGKVRRLHIVVLAPSLSVVEKINRDLSKIGNLSADGRPILGLDAKKLSEIVLNIDKNCFVIPAHIWTPWFAMFGSKSGFDSIEECYEELTDTISCVETGLSSDPPMNWRVSRLDDVTLCSNSDAHSLPNIAREANVFEIDPRNLSYSEICDILKSGDKKRFLHTIEFYPEEGIYHWDGHRVCGVSFPPKETKKHGGICPVCKKSLTIGVEYRTDQLADRPEGYAPKNRVGYKKLVELDKIIAESLNIKSRNSKKVQEEYHAIISKGKTELEILMDTPLEEIGTFAPPQIVEGIKRVREGKLFIKPGYDGLYGKVHIFKDEEKRSRQKSLF